MSRRSPFKVAPADGSSPADRAPRGVEMKTPPTYDDTWHDGPLGILRRWRVLTFVAFLLVVGAIWLKYGNAPTAIAPQNAVAHFQDADGAFTFTGAATQRAILAFVVLALGLLVATVMRAGRGRGWLGLLICLLALIAVRQEPKMLHAAMALVACGVLGGALFVRREERTRFGSRALIIGLTLVIGVLAMPFGSRHDEHLLSAKTTTPGAYISPGLLVATELFSPPAGLEDDIAEGIHPLVSHILSQWPWVIAMALAILGLIAAAGVRGRVVATLASLLLWMLVIGVCASIGIDAHLHQMRSDVGAGWSAPDAIGEAVRKSYIAFVLPLAAAIAELGRIRHRL